MTFSLASHVTSTETDTGMVLLDERTGRYWQLNDTGALVLRCLLAGGTVASAASTLHERFSGAPEAATADVEKLVDALRAAKMVAS
ncbi:lasso peptide biosynthesis PqqD family chaperone [Streptomyces sp. NEAU-YJ-81]|uniref:lasso peptide biosynthesis PqqD family chaperone n=1 Tax=Streptomyces sp. NEAU-YJ-81 TaxID=2820288 RepID=UPI001ABBF27E|nr:lasso peptide biosynthesis PqqD family chaperone [Streptomyces sp. NEAU-YJ-81]MBO3679692.1 lasso peptide biosynthesis PqqD family chaperone [Streptomyces sp. NEAU-YJ-81]